MAGWAKETLPGGSLKYLFVYLKVLAEFMDTLSGWWFGT